ncbi:MAG: HpcH/HpaI aldolase family protein [Inquilinaceae bacterium]
MSDDQTRADPASPGGPRPNRLKRRLRAGDRVPALWVQMESPTVVEAAVHAGWDTILIDNEHGWVGYETLLHMMRAAEAAGGDVILRVPDAEMATLKRALDLGVQSIMVPMVNSAAAARSIAEACRYPTLGTRGYAAPVVRASRYGADPGYAGGAHNELLLIAQIEHADAVAAIDAIAAVDGIDMLFIGPNDLAGSLGRLERLDHPDVEAAIRAVEAATLKAGKLLGTIPRPGRDVAGCYADGHHLCACASDIVLFRRAAVEALRGAM